MQKTQTEKQASRLIFLCWLVYTTAYLGRLNFNACLVEVIDSLGTTKAAAGLVTSCFFFAYGAGQLLNGILSKRYRPRPVIATVLLISAGLNVAMPLVGNIGVMKYLWLVNGLVQSVLWSTLLRTLGVRLPQRLMKRAVLVMSTTTAIGTAAIYGLSALFVWTLSWQYVFYGAAIVLCAVAAVWFFCFPTGDLRGEEEEQADAKAEGAALPKMERRALLTLLGVMLVLAVFTNFIKDGLTTWTPDILKELYHFPNAISIVLTLTLPLLAISGAYFSVRLNRRIQSFTALAGVFFAVAFVATGILFVCLRWNVWLVTLVGFAVTVCAVSAVNNVLTSMAPLALRESIDVGLTAGLLNSFCYVGSTLSSVLLGAMADGGSGWNGVFRLILAMTVLATVIGFGGSILERRSARK